MNKTNFGDYLNKSKSRKIYKIFDQNLGESLVIGSLGNFSNLIMAVWCTWIKKCTQNDGTIEQIWIDKANQFGVAVTWKDNSIIDLLCVR